MSEVRKYVLVDKDDQEYGAPYDIYAQAERQAQIDGSAVVAQVYEYADSELVFTPNGSETWPPPTGRESGGIGPW